jgi:hypothetical protein
MAGSDAEQPAPEAPVRGRHTDARTGRDAAAQRARFQSQYVDQQIRLAMERGEFDDLPGAGKPIEGLGETHDRDWWLKKFIEREQVTGVLPDALQLRKDDLELDAQLDREFTEKAVRELLEAFNARVINARRQLQGGPPVITPPRDVEAEIAAWRERRTTRGVSPSGPAASAPARPAPRRPRLLGRIRRRRGG